MKFKSFILERKIQSVPAATLGQAFRKLFEKAFTEEAFRKDADIDHDQWTFDEWKEHKLEILNHFVSIHKEQVDIDIQTFILTQALVLKSNKYDANEAKEILEIFKTLASKYGWFINNANIHEDDERLPRMLKISFRPNYTERLEKNISGPLYHMSLLVNKNSILKRGIITRGGGRSSTWQHPSRVYLFTKYDESYIHQLAIAMGSIGFSAEDQYYGRIDKSPIVVFKVDQNKLAKGTKFYNDPDAKNAVWTYSNIPAEALSIVYEDKDDEI